MIGSNLNISNGVVKASQATSSLAGAVKLYTSTGSNTDGTITQKSITNAINAYPTISYTGTLDNAKSIPANIDTNTILLTTGTLPAGIYLIEGLADFYDFPSSFTAMCRVSIFSSAEGDLRQTRSFISHNYHLLQQTIVVRDMDASTTFSVAVGCHVACKATGKLRVVRLK